MILGLLGQVFQAVGRTMGDEAGRDLAEVGSELRRLEVGPAQRPTSSR